MPSRHPAREDSLEESSPKMGLSGAGSALGRGAGGGERVVAPGFLGWGHRSGARRCTGRWRWVFRPGGFGFSCPCKLARLGVAGCCPLPCRDGSSRCLLGRGTNWDFPPLCSIPSWKSSQTPLLAAFAPFPAAPWAPPAQGHGTGQLLLGAGLWPCHEGCGASYAGSLPAPRPVGRR